MLVGGGTWLLCVFHLDVEPSIYALYPQIEPGMKHMQQPCKGKVDFTGLWVWMLVEVGWGTCLLCVFHLDVEPGIYALYPQIEPGMKHTQQPCKCKVDFNGLWLWMLVGMGVGTFILFQCTDVATWHVHFWQAKISRRKLSYARHTSCWICFVGRNSSVGRALDWRSKGPWFNPGFRQMLKHSAVGTFSTDISNKFILDPKGRLHLNCGYSIT